MLVSESTEGVSTQVNERLHVFCRKASGGDFALVMHGIVVSMVVGALRVTHLLLLHTQLVLVAVFLHHVLRVVVLHVFLHVLVPIGAWFVLIGS